jgi:hypothetical protein
VLISSLNILTLGDGKRYFFHDRSAEHPQWSPQSMPVVSKDCVHLLVSLTSNVASEQPKAASAQTKDNATQKVKDSTSVEKYVLAIVDDFKTNWYLRTVKYLAGVGSWIETESKQNQRHQGNEAATKPSSQLPLERWFRSDHRDEPWTTATATVSKHS